MSTATNEAIEVGNQLVALCSQGQNLEAINTLYADNIVSVEVMDCPEMNMPQTMEGIEAIRGKNQWWAENHEVHSGNCIGPFPHGDQFIVIFDYDVTNKPSGQRCQMQEAGLFTVAGGKIVKEEFFYEMPSK